MHLEFQEIKDKHFFLNIYKKIFVTEIELNFVSSYYGIYNLFWQSKRKCTQAPPIINQAKIIEFFTNK